MNYKKEILSALTDVCKRARKEGFEEGHEAGVEEGIKIGHNFGFKEGLETNEVLSRPTKLPRKSIKSENVWNLSLSQLSCYLSNPDDEDTCATSLESDAYYIAIKLFLTWDQILASYEKLIDQIDDDDDILNATKRVDEWCVKTMRSTIASFYEDKILVNYVKSIKEEE